MVLAAWNEARWFCGSACVVALVYIIVRAGFKVRSNSEIRRELYLQMMPDARLCLKCGYDVRHTSGQCLECGWPVQLRK